MALELSKSSESSSKSPVEVEDDPVNEFFKLQIEAPNQFTSAEATEPQFNGTNGTSAPQDVPSNVSEKPQITLLAADKEFTVDVDILKCSSTIWNAIENDPDEESRYLPLTNINGNILEKVIEWATQHKDAKPVTNEMVIEGRFDEVPEWDAAFFKPMEKLFLFELTEAANFLDMKQLFDFSLKTIANRYLRGKTTEEMREHFGIINDISPEKEYQIKLENEMIEERT